MLRGLRTSFHAVDLVRSHGSVYTPDIPGTPSKVPQGTDELFQAILAFCGELGLLTATEFVFHGSPTDAKILQDRSIACESLSTYNAVFNYLTCISILLRVYLISVNLYFSRKYSLAL
jgi:hypothetical protein